MRKHCDGTTYLEVPNYVLDLGVSTDANPGYSTADAADATRLIGADAFSLKYDDDRHSERADNDELHAARKDVAAMELWVLSALSYGLTKFMIVENVHVVVDSGVQLGLISKGSIRLTRDKRSDEPFLAVEGDMFYQVGGGPIPMDNEGVPCSSTKQ